MPLTNILGYLCQTNDDLGNSPLQKIPGSRALILDRLRTAHEWVQT